MKTGQAVSYAFEDRDLVSLHDDKGQYVLRVRDREDHEKPREKMLQVGSTNLTMAELVAIVFGTGTRKEEVMTMSDRLLREYGETTILHETNPGRLATITGIPSNKACQLVACLELGRRFYQSKNLQPAYVRTAEQAYRYVEEIATSQKEQLRGIYLNSRYQVIHSEVISVGSLTANIVHPREVFQPAIEHGAVAVIVAHNHPSGDKQPSKEDRQVTLSLQKAGELLGIELLDHLIVVKGGYNSLMGGE